MATLVLTTVGTIFGGPLGGALGAIAGQAIDQRVLFKPKGRQGPRLSDLRVQTSSYGSAIPKLFGTMRVAGTVIWATDLREEKSKSGGGKGRPSTISYSYSVSFAVLLSARPIKRVGRVWADGNLLRGQAGDFKTETGFRLHPGGEDQPVDALIASAEGAGLTPAYCGGAYAVFEGFQLAAYGNRIPSLTFEVTADDDAVGVAAILESISDHAVAGVGGVALGGFAASGDSVRGVVETLSEAIPLRIVDDGDRLRLADEEAAPRVVASEEHGAFLGDHGENGDRTETAALTSVPRTVSISYYEMARDYQAGLQRARRPGPGRRDVQIELPAVLSAVGAKALAEQAVARGVRESVVRTVRCDWRMLDLRPGAIVTLEGVTGRWRVRARSIERMLVTLELVRVSDAAPVPANAEPGRSLPAPDLVNGATTVMLLDLPVLGDAPVDVPRLYIAAAGESPGWRRAGLLLSLDGGASYETIGSTAPAATMGWSVNALSGGVAALIDQAHSVDIALLSGAMVLQDADASGLAGGANAALLGDEIIQFGRAEPIGDGVWRLSMLMRGRRGTEWAMDAHAPGERFVLLEPATLLSFDPPAGAAGATARVLASGVGDDVAAEASVAAIGACLAPPAPVRFRAVGDGAGGFILRWVRRSRAGWRWTDGVDAPLGEEAERYRLLFVREDGSSRSVTVQAPEFEYDSAAVGNDLAVGASVVVSIAQIGTSATSRPVTIDINLA